MRTLSLVSIFAFLLGLASPAAAYSHSFTNRSPVTVRFWVNYAACSNDSWYVKPGQVITWRSGLCCITDVNVQGQRGTETNVSGVKIPGYKSWPSIQWPMMTCRNSNWSYDSKKAVNNYDLLDPQDYAISGP